jgi:aminopeptidase YwaD
MTYDPLLEKAAAYLHMLCVELPTRRVGSPGNRAATDFFAGTVNEFGFETESPTFECIDWVQGGSWLRVGDATFASHVSPYSLGWEGQASLVVISTLEELQAAEVSGCVALLRGELAKEQLMPKNFTFYNPPAHKAIYQLLETKGPVAIIAATSRDPEMAGAVYPFPLIEDGDFDIPSVYMTEEEGSRLAEQAGKRVTLEIRAVRAPALGCNVIARKAGSSGKRIVFFAHIDAKEGTPGALDNAAGVVTLLLLAGLLADTRAGLGVEITALNGEDYYSAPGEMQWLDLNRGRLEDIVLGINLDGLGYRQGKTAYSTYGCPPEMDALIQRALSAYEGLILGEPWYQSDLGLFIQNQVPALAITSEYFVDLWQEIAHTPKDRPEIVDPARLVETAHALRDLLLALNLHAA